jgi:hypothetical protein
VCVCACVCVCVRVFYALGNTFLLSNIFFLNAIFFLGSCKFLLNRAKIGARWLSRHPTTCLLSSNLTRYFGFILLKTYTSNLTPVVYIFARSCLKKMHGCTSRYSFTSKPENRDLTLTYLLRRLTQPKTQPKWK